MLKVVLVDDEPSVLEGLRIFVDWEKLGFEIVGEAFDGASGFSVISGTRPELVICDIRMPVLDGLQLVEKVNLKIEPVPKFVILSCYNDFFYAQKALHLGVLGYMIKPLDAEELERELARVAEIIKKENVDQNEYLEFTRYMVNNVYNDILDGKRGGKLSQKARIFFGEPKDGEKMRLVQFITGPHDESGKKNEIGYRPKAEIYDLLLRITGIPEQEKGRVFYNGQGSYIAIIYENRPGLITEKLGEPGVDFCFYTLISGAPDYGGDLLEDIYSCGKQLEKLQSWCMLHPDKTVISYESFTFYQPEEIDKTEEFSCIFTLPFDKLAEAMKGSDILEVTRAVDEFFKILNQSGVPSRIYAICLYRLADVVGRMAYAYGIEASKVIHSFTAAVNGIQSCALNSARDCHKQAKAMCSFIFEKQNIHNDKPITLLEDEIVGYIKTNYQKNLSLQMIAEEFSLSALIISKIVKKKTGQKFNHYFNALRIEHAKRLIASDNMKITAVSEASGYSDYGYFTEKFKELTGVSPSEYKKKYL